MDPKEDEITSSQPTEWKQRRKASEELTVNKNLQDSQIDVLQRDIVEVNTEILQLKSKTKSFIVELRRTTMCLAVICVITRGFVRFFLVDSEFC